MTKRFYFEIFRRFIVNFSCQLALTSASGPRLSILPAKSHYLPCFPHFVTSIPSLVFCQGGVRMKQILSSCQLLQRMGAGAGRDRTGTHFLRRNFPEV